MVRYWIVPVIGVITFLAIPVSISYYDYNYVERDYVFSRGHYLSSENICDAGVLYKKQYGAVFNKDESNVSCSIVTMTPADRYSK